MAADPETGIITDEQLTKAAGHDNSDPAVAEQFLAAEAGGPGASGSDSPDDPAGGQSLDAAGGQDSDGDRDHARGGGQLAWYGDSAYGTGDLRDAIGKAGHEAVIKPKPLQPPVAGGFTLEVPHRFRTGDPVGFSPGKDGNECREKRKDTLLSSRSRLPGR